jgi:hypothetical protein
MGGKSWRKGIVGIICNAMPTCSWSKLSSQTKQLVAAPFSAHFNEMSLLHLS